MLLTSILRRLRRDDQGAAMAAVIGLMATGLIITALIAGNLIVALGQTTSTRAGVQSQAAAEAGIAAARAGLILGSCASQPTFDGAPAYQSDPADDLSYVATVWRPDGGGGWTPGCPAGLTTQVRILSTGYAASTGAGNDSRDATSIEAVLSAAGETSIILALGPAVYAYNAGAFGNGGQLVSLDGSTPDVIVANGSVTCDNNFQATANLVVNGGTLTVDNGCEVSGNAWSSGRIDMVNSGTIGGYAIADGVSMANSASVQRIWSTADVTTSGNVTVNGSIKAFEVVLQGGTFGGPSYVYGPMAVTRPNQVQLTGDFTTQALTTDLGNWTYKSRITVQNPITSPTFASDLPPAPIVPNWVDFGSDPAHYTTDTWSGFTVVTMGTSCGFSDLTAAVTSLGSNPGVIDGRACSSGVRIDQNNALTQRNDLAIIADSIVFDNQGTIRTDGGEYRTWLINPDTVANGQPDCAAGQKLAVYNNAQFIDVDVLMYSPCAVELVAGIEVDGQIFAGSAGLGNNSTLAYAPVGLPGYNLTYGTEVDTVVSTESDRELVAVRNIAEGN